MEKDEVLLKTFEKFGNKYFSIGSDQQLKEWGHSDDAIREIKIERINNWIALNQNAFELYKVLNQFSGGENKF